MAFFLIGRGSDSDLRLISPKSFESRQAAMAELSTLSAEPTFAHWDAEVSVMDLDTGAPVLLVRSAAATPAAEVAPTTADVAGAWEADVAAPAAEEPAVATAVTEQPVAPVPEAAPEAPSAFAFEPAPADVTQEPVAETEPEAPVVAPDAIEAPFWEPPSMALIEPVNDTAIADAIVEEAAAPEPADEVPAEIVEPEPADARVQPAPEVPAGYSLATPDSASDADDNDELRAAILRTTEHMSAEGITPPESVGLAPAQAEQPAELVSAVTAEPQAPATVAETKAAEVEAPAAAEAAPAAATQESSPPPKVGFWPWARAANSSDAEGTGVAPEVAGVYDALQEPATELPEPDVEAVLRNSVLLPVEDASAVDHESAPNLPMSSLPSDGGGLYAPLPDADVDSSDFILDLDAVESAPPATAAETEPVGQPKASDSWSFGGPEALPQDEAVTKEPAAQDEPESPAAVVSPLQDYTCEDCVYVSTCPNRDQRLPKDCGSFQWR